MQLSWPYDLGFFRTIVETGGNTVLILALMYSVKTLWGLVIAKDGQLMEERTKREELIKESILASRSMFESTEKIVKALERIEKKVV